MNPTYDFSGQVAFVTGAGSGMGLATARAFADAGAAVTLADSTPTPSRRREGAHRRRTPRPRRAMRRQRRGPGCARRDPTVDTFGRLDMAYNNAGIQSPTTDAADEPAEVFDRVNGINLRGIWASMKHELAQMRRRAPARSSTAPRSAGLSACPDAPPTTPPSTASSA